MVGVQSTVSTQSGPRFAPVEISPAPTPVDQSQASAVSAAAPSSRTAGLIDLVLLSGISLRMDANVDSRALRARPCSQIANAS